MRVFYYSMQLFCKDILLILKIISTNMDTYIFCLIKLMNN